MYIISGSGNVFVSKKVYVKKDGQRLLGYASTVVYKNRVSALKACAASKTCNGVTRERRMRFRLNTGKSPKSQRGMKCWIKDASFTTTDDYRYTTSTGYVSTIFLTRVVYKTEKSAQKACSKNPKCSGVSKVKTKNYRLNKGGVVKTSPGSMVYPKGNYYTTERIVNLGDKAYIGYTPVGMGKYIPHFYIGIFIYVLCPNILQTLILILNEC